MSTHDDVSIGLRGTAAAAAAAQKNSCWTFTNSFETDQMKLFHNEIKY